MKQKAPGLWMSVTCNLRFYTVVKYAKEIGLTNIQQYGFISKLITGEE